MIEGFIVGLVAGLSVALPLGAVAVLLLREGVERGRPVAVGAAAGIAVADAIFATLAVVFGPAVGGLLSGHQRQIQIASAMVLAAIAVAGTVRTLWRRGMQRPAAVGESARTPGAAFLRFLAITLANPLTVVYFAVVATGVASVVRGTGQGLAFVLGVLLGSGGWQLTLALASGTLSGRISPRAKSVTSVAGYLLVLVLAGALVLEL